MQHNWKKKGIFEFELENEHHQNTIGLEKDNVGGVGGKGGEEGGEKREIDGLIEMSAMRTANEQKQ